MKRVFNKRGFSSALPIRQLSEWLVAGFFIFLSLFFLFLTGLNDRTEQQLRVWAGDITAPVLVTIITPFEEAVLSIEMVGTWLNTLKENQQLRAENQRLRQWYQVALSLKNEQEQLSQLLHIKNEKAQGFLTTRLVTDPNQSFFQNVLIPIGSSDNVAVGHAALVEGTLAGRVIDVGHNSSRVLMVTDINSRIPVFVGTANNRAILAGQNSSKPILDHLPRDSNIQVGDKVMTSGQGGLFYPGLPIGVVQSIEEQNTKVKLYVDFQTLDYIQIVDYGLVDPLE